MTRLARSLEHVRPHYDVIVVGSGYGGGVSAMRLARAGKRVAVIERGREVATGEFPSRFPDMRHEMRVTSALGAVGSPTGLYDVRLGEDMHVLVGRGLGGGSLINAGVALRPDARVFADPVWHGQLRQDGHLDEGYARARRWLRPARDPEATSLTKYKALESASAALGVPPIAPEIVVGFADTINPAGIAQPACTRCGDCCAGCNVGAKNTVALTYRPDAAQHGAELFTHGRVTHLAPAPGGGWSVHVERVDTPGEGHAQNLTLTAELVILAAGTLGSTEILLRSRAKGLSLSDRLGERFSANGDIIAFGYGAKVR
jgi:cholesterol oxidase